MRTPFGEAAPAAWWSSPSSRDRAGSAGVGGIGRPDAGESMRAGHASRTAEHNALFRAIENSLPASRRLFEDPLARSFLTWPLSVVPRLTVVPGLRELIPWYIDRAWPGTRTSVVARTRLIDDAIADALVEPFEQLVVLGAGFDSRAYRLPRLRGIRVFEVDHPDTQAAKRQALARALHGLPANVCFVATDFTERDLAAAMVAAGYRESARSVILWEGVTNYLTEDAVDTTLRWCARSPTGSLLLFTYIHPDVLERPSVFVGTKRLFAALERFGERFTFGIDPGALRDFLARRGLSLVSDVGAAEYRERYFGEAARKMRGHEFYRVAIARVGKPVARATPRGLAGAEDGRGEAEEPASPRTDPDA
jgi:methyltransferase (TIGR00027 family)